jgi:endonuclease/exonuclease/phosphatase family metal-dependent hydrolase
MTRILSYNILVGGNERIDQIEQMIRTVDPDVVGLVEANNPQIVQELASRLGMEYRTNASPDGSWRTSIALLSRLPIVQSVVHASPGLLARPLLEVTLEEAHGEQLTAFVTHLIASFSHGRGNDKARRKEVREVLHILRANHGPHVLMGDFNSLAPGDMLKGSNLLCYLVEMDQRHHQGLHKGEQDGHPSLNGVVPAQLRFLNPLLCLIPRNKLLGTLFDEAVSLYVPRGCIGLLREAGYVDCFRYVNPRAWGFTCPAAAPAGRIDYLFANPVLATRLSACKVVSGDEFVSGEEASDHLPVMVEFGVGLETTFRPYKDDLVEAGETVGEAL